MAALALAGVKFGRWTVIRRVEPGERLSHQSHWLCHCECGTERVLQAASLRNGRSKSCGCLNRELASIRFMKHGCKTKALRNGTKEYSAWKDAKGRCHNPTHRWFKFYGAKGVTMCDGWREDFSVFLRDMGPCPEGLTLDRIDPFGSYEPNNCRWADWATQAKNQRRNHKRPA